MVKWRVKLYMQSGRVLEGIYGTGETSSSEVAMALMKCNGSINTLNAMRNIEDSSQILFLVSQVEALEIMPL